MTSLAENSAGYAIRETQMGAQTIAYGWARYLTTVTLRVSVLVVLPALFWSSIVAIIS